MSLENTGKLDLIEKNIDNKQSSAKKFSLFKEYHNRHSREKLSLKNIFFRSATSVTTVEDDENFSPVTIKENICDEIGESLKRTESKGSLRSFLPWKKNNETGQNSESPDRTMDSAESSVLLSNSSGNNNLICLSNKDQTFGLVKKQDKSSNVSLSRLTTPLNDDTDNSELSSGKEADSCVEAVTNNESPLTPEYEDPIDGAYKFVFETPNRYSSDDLLNLDPKTVSNFKNIWDTILLYEPEIGDFDESILVSKLSSLILNFLERKTQEYNNDTETLKEEVIEISTANQKLHEDLNSIRDENILLSNKYKTLKFNHKILGEKYNKSANKLKDLSAIQVKAESKDMKLEKLMNENKKLTHNLALTQDQNFHLKKQNNELNDKIKLFDNRMNVMKCFKESSWNFMFNLMQKTNGIVNEQTLSKYNNSMKKISYSLSLVNMTTPLISQIEELKTQINEFYVDIAEDVLLHEIISKWSMNFRSKEFLTQQLFEIRKKNSELEKKIESITETNNKEHARGNSSHKKYARQKNNSSNRLHKNSAINNRVKNSIMAINYD